MRHLLIVTATLGGLLAYRALGASPPEDELSIPFHKAPLAVRTTLEAHLDGATVRVLDVELVEGRLIYEAEWERSGREREVEVDEHGELLSIEDDLAAEELPAHVLAAIGIELPGGVPVEASRTLRAFYSVEVEVGGVARELLITPEGRVVRPPER